MNNVEIPETCPNCNAGRVGIQESRVYYPCGYELQYYRSGGHEGLAESSPCGYKELAASVKVAGPEVSKTPGATTSNNVSYTCDPIEVPCPECHGRGKVLRAL